jgi:hypothetical protein
MAGRADCVAGKLSIPLECAVDYVGVRKLRTNCSPAAHSHKQKNSPLS